MEAKKVLRGIVVVCGAYLLGKGYGYLDCMKDVVNQHSDLLPEGKLELKGSGKKRKYSITMSNPKAEES